MAQTFFRRKNSTEDDSRSGRQGFINAGLVDSVLDTTEEDRRVSIRELSDRIGVGKTTIDVILKERLEINKVCARWIPRILIEEGIGIDEVFASSTP